MTAHTPDGGGLTEAEREVEDWAAVLALTEKWEQAATAARKSEHHWPADCLMEAADAYRRLARATHTDPRETVAAALDEVELRIYRRRNEHWQQHLREHPYADATSCPGDYGMHDAYEHAAGIVRARAAEVRAAGNQEPDGGAE